MFISSVATWHYLLPTVYVVNPRSDLLGLIQFFAKGLVPKEGLLGRGLRTFFPVVGHIQVGIFLPMNYLLGATNTTNSIF